MKEKIIESAGKLWKILGEKGPIALGAVPGLLKTNDRIAYQALGWLAREDKLVYTKKGVQMFVALNGREKEIFNVRKTG